VSTAVAAAWQPNRFFNAIAHLLVLGALLGAAQPVSAQFTPQSTLSANNAVGNAGQGQSVALSADGNTAIVGGPQDTSGFGAAWVFTVTLRRGPSCGEMMSG
jgi:hypothetical protein